MTQQPSLLDRVREERKIARRQRSYAQRTSKLARHRHAIAEMHNAGATLADIQHFLLAIAKPSVPVARSTILRYLQKIEA